MFERLVVTVGHVLDRGQPTRFRFEATTRYALRVHFIYQGRSWALSDFMAAEVVRTALASIGARRPSWYEAQPGFTRTRGDGGTYCANVECGRPIMRVSNQAHLAYCSEACRLEQKNRRQYQEHQAERVAYSQTRRDRLRAAAAPRACERCGRSFQPLDVGGKPPQRFCGKVCRSAHASGFAASWRPHRLRSQTGQFVRAE